MDVGTLDMWGICAERKLWRSIRPFLRCDMSGIWSFCLLMSPGDETGVATHGRDGSFARYPSKALDGESAGSHMRAKAIHYSGMIVENEDLTEVTSRAEVYRIKVLGPLGLSLVADRH